MRVGGQRRQRVVRVDVGQHRQRHRVASNADGRPRRCRRGCRRRPCAAASPWSAAARTRSRPSATRLSSDGSSRPNDRPVGVTSSAPSAVRAEMLPDAPAVRPRSNIDFASRHTLSRRRASALMARPACRRRGRRNRPGRSCRTSARAPVVGRRRAAPARRGRSRDRSRARSRRAPGRPRRRSRRRRRSAGRSRRAAACAGERAEEALERRGAALPAFCRLGAGDRLGVVGGIDERQARLRCGPVEHLGRIDPPATTRATSSFSAAPPSARCRATCARVACEQEPESASAGRARRARPPASPVAP